jgi:ABC-type Fe3+/spermidine/putrescine transport system ATPase subunit
MGEMEDPTACDMKPESVDKVIELIGLRKVYGNSTAVDDVSLDARRGELVCLLGPSGCGKTTTLRMVAGFIQPSRGSIKIEGKEVSDLPPYRRDTGMVFQNYALFPHMTIAQNVAFGLENVGMGRAQRSTRVSEMLEMVELAHLVNRYPKELSGGQQQRVALARALALRPAVLLLDEPFSNLDAQLRVRLRQEMRRVLESMNITTLFVTHDQEEALMLSDRIAVINKGRLEQVGTPEDIYERPASQFVAQFIGSCNVFEGEVRAGIFYSRGGLEMPAGDVTPGNRTLMIRPEYLEPVSDGFVGPSLSATVESVDYFGSISRMTVRTGSDQILVDVRRKCGATARPGDAIRIGVRPDGIRILDWKL